MGTVKDKVWLCRVRVAGGGAARHESMHESRIFFL